MRQYYSMRTGKNPQSSGIDLATLISLFVDIFRHFSEQDYFQDAFGYDCVDAGYVPGTLGHDIEAQIFRKLRKSKIWPIEEKSPSYSEDDIFDMIEFLFDHISKPIDGTYHDFADCGWHYNEFNKGSGQQEFRQEINQVLKDYGDGFEIHESGEILVIGRVGLDFIFRSDIHSMEPDKIDERVKLAIGKFRRYRSTLEDRKDAIRDLADVLEYLRPKAKEVLTKKDENDLFMIANGFGIRHHNEKQKTDYDKRIWYSWMFYYYLATIHAVTRLIQQYETESNKEHKN